MLTFAGPLLLVALPARLGAEETTNILAIDPSVRAAGSGGAGAAAFWGCVPNAWANPALLGYWRGVCIEAGRSASSGPTGFQAERVGAGLMGIGGVAVGRPRNFGRMQLDRGNALPAAEHLESWGAGVSLSQVLSNALDLAGAEIPDVLRRWDVAGGMMQHDVRVAGADPTAPGEARVTDYGGLIRYTPVNTLDPKQPPRVEPEQPWRFPRARDPMAGRFPSLRRVRPNPKRVDFAYAYSVRNADNATLDFPTALPSPIARVERHGFAMRRASGTPSRARTPWLGRAFTPLVSFGASYDRERIHPGDGNPADDVKRSGVEFTWANVLSLRTGHIDDAYRDVRGTTYGAGLGFDFGDAAGVRVDWARVPEVGGRVERRGGNVWVDPLAILRRTRSAPPPVLDPRERARKRAAVDRARKAAKQAQSQETAAPEAPGGDPR